MGVNWVFTSLKISCGSWSGSCWSCWEATTKLANPKRTRTIFSRAAWLRSNLLLNLLQSLFLRVLLRKENLNWGTVHYDNNTRMTPLMTTYLHFASSRSQATPATMNWPWIDHIKIFSSFHLWIASIIQTSTIQISTDPEDLYTSTALAPSRIARAASSAP